MLESWQINTSTVASSKSVRMNLHLLAFDSGREAQHHDHQISSASCAEGILFLAFRNSPHQTGLRATDGLEIFNLDGIRMAFLEMHRLGLSRRRTMSGPIFNNQISVEPYTIPVLANESDDVVSRLGWDNSPCPAHRVVIGQLCRNTCKAPKEIYCLIDAGQDRSAF